MSASNARAAVKRRRKRSFRRKTLPKKRLILLLLTVLLLIVGVYYIFRHQERMQYLRYPLRHEELIISCADQFGLQPWHVAAVIRCESSFRDEATSEVGAMGLMQLMPDTGEWIAGKFDEEASFTADRLYEPETNIKYGCWFLSWLMNRYEGDRALATAAYHAGHGKVDAWLADPDVSPDGKTIPKIPYQSTGTYVGRVLEACEKYQELYDFSGSDRND